MNTAQKPPPALTLHSSRKMEGWFERTGASLAFTTYDVGKLFLLGLRPDNKLSIFERSFPRCMGLGWHGTGFWMASQYQVWRFEEFLTEGQSLKGYDALYVPVTGWTTGDLDLHDIHDGVEGPVFVATRFNCLGRLSERSSFRPVWRPPFIDRIAAEDRCHMNGLAMRDGRPAYVTCVSETNVIEGWREHRIGGGVVIDVQSSEVVARGLSMPHSPRLHNGKLWLVQSGIGEFGYIDPATGQFEAVCFLPGFARGIAFVDNWAVIGVSKPRGGQRTFEGLPLDDRLAKEKISPRCCLCFVDLQSGDIAYQIDIEGVVSELYDIAILPGVRRPSALGFKSDEIQYQIRLDLP